VPKLAERAAPVSGQGGLFLLLKSQSDFIREWAEGDAGQCSPRHLFHRALQNRSQVSGIRFSDFSEGS
jgi:hypothetical protein